jgi:hypothetical protein
MLQTCSSASVGLALGGVLDAEPSISMRDELSPVPNSTRPPEI